MKSVKLVLAILLVSNCDKLKCVSSAGEKKFQLFTSPHSFLEAITFCKRLGMNLAEIMSKEENEAVLKKIRNYGNLADWDGFWVGGTDLTEEGAWLWINSGRALEFKAWDGGQPDNIHQSEHCLLLSKIPQSGVHWNDEKCDTKNKFICQKDG